MLRGTRGRQNKMRGTSTDIICVQQFTLVNRVSTTHIQFADIGIGSTSGVRHERLCHDNVNSNENA